MEKREEGEDVVGLDGDLEQVGSGGKRRLRG